MMKMKNRFVLFLLLAFTSVVCADEAVIVKLTPPIMNSETILKEVTCTRPMREGRFNISTEVFEGKKESKKIVNCYGMGGSGWTTLFGSVEKAVSLFQNDFKVSKDTPVRVIGSGCMGLTAAIELSSLGYKVAGISTKELYDLPSWRAAGYFGLVSVKTSPEEQLNLDQIGMATFNRYRQIEQGSHPYITSDAVRFMPVYCSKDTESGVEQLEAYGLIPAHENVTLDFGNGTLHPEYVKYMTYFMDTTKLMQQLTAEVNKLGIPVEMKEIASFDDVKEEVVFNCSGLGGRELNQDQNMIPVRGHLILLNDQSGSEHMDYMIYTKVYQDGKEEYVYMFPKALSVTSSEKEGLQCRGTLGGTFIPNADQLPPDELEKLDRTEFDKLLDRNAMFFNGTPFPKN